MAGAAGGSGFACAYQYLNSFFQQYFAAMNSAQWSNGQACGQCVVARCIDPACPVQNHDVLVQIVDKCPECLEGSLDFSYPAYTALTGSWPNRLKISWQYATSCAPFVSGGILYTPKAGIQSNGFWKAFFLANYKYPLSAVIYQGTALPSSQFQFFQMYSNIPTGPFQLTLVAINGQQVVVTINDVNTAQQLSVNFS